MSEQAPMSADELERLGDEAHARGNDDEAIRHWWDAIGAFLVDDDSGHDDATDPLTRLDQFVTRLTAKVQRIHHERKPPPKSLDEQAAGLRAAIAESTESGDIAHASHVSIDLGDVLDELGDHDGAESAYRQAVAFARQVDAALPELTLWAFGSLIDFLAPSEESVALAQEMATNLIERDEMYHPMRAADAAHNWAMAELRHAEVAQHRVDHAIDGVARQAIAMLDDICFHGKGQDLQRQVAHLLRCAGRHAEADQWQADADRYHDWSVFMEQEMPGHDHLWDIRIDLPVRTEAVLDHSD